MHIIRKRSLNQSSMKHIDLKYHFLREEISKGVIELKSVESARNIAEIFTKHRQHHIFWSYGLYLMFRKFRHTAPKSHRISLVFLFLVGIVTF